MPPQSRSLPLTDEQIMNAACNAADALDATRVSELRDGKWHATTIFDGDSGLLRFGRLIEQAINAAASETQAWIPVSQRLPDEEGPDVLVMLGETMRVAEVRRKGRGVWIADQDIPWGAITHWRPLPEAPK